MSSYETLAGAYDALTTDVGYRRRADYLEKLFAKSKLPVHTVLDLACGTGTLSCLLAERGYELIGVDASAEMLMQAQNKALSLTGERPIFLCQSMPELDLYGTVDACVCCLDSINYLTKPKDLRRTLERLRLFIAPGGLLVFDVHSVAHLEGLDNQVFLDETEEVYCVWRTEYSHRSRVMTYWMDIFTRTEEGWQRSSEEHRERAYTVEELHLALESCGFTKIRIYGDLRQSAPREGEERLVFTALRGENRRIESERSK